MLYKKATIALAGAAVALWGVHIGLVVQAEDEDAAHLPLYGVPGSLALLVSVVACGVFVLGVVRDWIAASTLPPAPEPPTPVSIPEPRAPGDRPTPRPRVHTTSSAQRPPDPVSPDDGDQVTIAFARREEHFPPAPPRVFVSFPGPAPRNIPTVEMVPVRDVAGKIVSVFEAGQGVGKRIGYDQCFSDTTGVHLGDETDEPDGYVNGHDPR